MAPVGAGRHTDQFGEASAEAAQRRAADREADLGEVSAEPAITQAIAERNAHVSRLLSPDFTALGWLIPRPARSSSNDLMVEAALQEFTAGRPEGLRVLLDRAGFQAR
jgi:hypothetical protein